MRTFSISLAVAAAFVAGASVLPAAADETGMASIHSWRKVGKKTCFIGHSHAGSGSGPNRKAAEAAAINSWRSFTALEYGSSWADFRIAIEKTMRCGANAPNNVACDLDATPCRPY